MLIVAHLIVMKKGGIGKQVLQKSKLLCKKRFGTDKDSTNDTQDIRFVL